MDGNPPVGHERESGVRHRYYQRRFRIVGKVYVRVCTLATLHGAGVYYRCLFLFWVQSVWWLSCMRRSQMPLLYPRSLDVHADGLLYIGLLCIEAIGG